MGFKHAVESPVDARIEVVRHAGSNGGGGLSTILSRFTHATESCSNRIDGCMQIGFVPPCTWWRRILISEDAQHVIRDTRQLIHDGHRCASCRTGPWVQTMTITVLPMATRASHRSPSSSGTRSTSEPPMPVEQHAALGPSRPGIRSSGVIPRIGTSATETLAPIPEVRC